jgi:hypothetical protein
MAVCETLVRAKYFAALTHGSPRNPAGSRPFAPNTATKKSTEWWIFIKLWCEQRGTHLTILCQFFSPFCCFSPVFYLFARHFA